jgi:hypothetical protein
MEAQSIDIAPEVILPTSTTSFIEANTLPISLDEMKKDHIIPVFVKDNEPLISHVEFIEVIRDKVVDYFHG